jgi:putative addiction module CopG family antidote
MNIALSKDLEEYVASQIETGHYASASEVIVEALRSQIKLSASRKFDERIALGRQQRVEGKVIPIDDAYFDKAREYVKSKYL